MDPLEGRRWGLKCRYRDTNYHCPQGKDWKSDLELRGKHNWMYQYQKAAPKTKPSIIRGGNHLNTCLMDRGGNRATSREWVYLAVWGYECQFWAKTKGARGKRQVNIQYKWIIFGKLSKVKSFLYSLFVNFINYKSTTFKF